MHFARPENLYLLLLLVPMALAVGFYFLWKRRLQKRVGHHHLIRAMAARHSNGRQVARAILVLMAAALLCVAAAQPQWGQDDRTIKRFGVDVVFALDLSNSMLAQDIPPNRLRAAKDEIETTLTTLNGDRVGLVVFTAISFAQSPLTTDYGAIRFYLDKLEPGQMPVGGTSVGQAVLDSVELLTGKQLSGDDEPAEEAPTEEIERAKNQIVVLITDGEDHESSPIDAARTAREYGINVVTVGMGSPEGSRIPVYNDAGNIKGYKRDQKGELVYTKLDEDTLKRVAAETGGTYMRYSGQNSVANGLADYIERLEKSELETMLRERYKDRFMYFLAPALLLLVLAVVLGERRRRPSGAPKRTDRAKSGSVLLILLALLGLSGCEDAFRDTLASVDRGNELVAQKEYEEALAEYREAETEVPARPELHYNLGIALLGAEQYDEARESFARALETQDPQLRFDALYNMALSLARQEKWKEAYEGYKETLRVQLDLDMPGNQERIEQARHNLEVAFRKLYPPCSQLEDDLEENDEPEAASTLDKKLSKEDLTLCGLDDDWYAIPVTVGTSIAVEAAFEQLREEPDPEHVFLPRPQDVQVAIFDASGEEVLAVDQGSQEGFDPEATSATRSIEKFRITPDMVDGPEGRVFVKVKATDAREFSYDLDITAIPPCGALEDDFEENDTREAARAIEAGNHKLHFCPGEEDWFELDLEMGDTLFVDLKPGEDREREEPPALQMELIDADSGEVVAEGRQDGGFLTAGVQNVAEAGTYLLHVRGETDDEQGPYSADIYQYAPCVVGDDRYEENDTARQAAPFDQQRQQHRYLRLCEGDRDFYKLPAPQPQGQATMGAQPQQPQQRQSKPDEPRKITWGLQAIADQGASAPEEAAPQDGAEPQAPALDLMSASGDQIIAAGAAPEAGAASDDSGDSEEARQARFDRVVRHETTEKSEFLLRVEGEQTFYHLVQLDSQGQNQDQNQKQQQDKKDQKQDDQSEDQKDKQDAKDEKQDESEQKKGEDNQKKDQKSDQPKDEEKKEDEQKKAERPEPQKPQQDPEQRRVEDILRALEENDENFQMKKALEDMPKRYIEKDW